MCRLSGSYGSLKLPKPLRDWTDLYLQIFPTKTESSPCMPYVKLINPKLWNTDTNNLVTVFTISKCTTATQFRPCQSQRTATSIGNKTHSPAASTLSSSRRHQLLLLGVSTRMLRNVPRSVPSKFLPTHNLWPPSFIRHFNPFRKADSCSDFKETAHPLWNPKYHHRSYKIPSLDFESNKSNIQLWTAFLHSHQHFLTVDL